MLNLVQPLNSEVEYENGYLPNMDIVSHKTEGKKKGNDIKNGAPLWSFKCWKVFTKNGPCSMKCYDAQQEPKKTTPILTQIMERINRHSKQQAVVVVIIYFVSSGIYVDPFKQIFGSRHVNTEIIVIKRLYSNNDESDPPQNIGLIQLDKMSEIFQRGKILFK